MQRLATETLTWSDDEIISYLRDEYADPTIALLKLLEQRDDYPTLADKCIMLEPHIIENVLIVFEAFNILNETHRVTDDQLKDFVGKNLYLMMLRDVTVEYFRRYLDEHFYKGQKQARKILWPAFVHNKYYQPYIISAIHRRVKYGVEDIVAQIELNEYDLFVMQDDSDEENYTDDQMIQSFEFKTTLGEFPNEKNPFFTEYQAHLIADLL